MISPRCATMSLVCGMLHLIHSHVVDEIPRAQLFLYPGQGHLFADTSLSDFDEEAAALLNERIRAFLDAVG